MPRGDRTGPAGMGPRTGRGLGLCSGYNQPGYANNLGGRGFGGGGGGFGRGWRNRNFAPVNQGWVAPATVNYPIAPVEPLQQMTAEQEIAMLKAESQNLQQSLENIEKRLAELSEEKK